MKKPKMKSRPNLRAYVVLVIVTAVSAGAVHLLHGFQVMRHADFFRSKAEDAQAAKQAADAIAHYESYLSLKPDDPETTAKFGLLLAEIGQNSRAYKVLTRAIQLAPNREDVHRKLAEVAVRIGRYVDARRMLKDLLEAHKQDPELLALLARCQLAAGDYLAAAGSLENALTADPKQVPTFLLLIDLRKRDPEQVFSRDKDWKAKDADYWANRMVELNPESAQAFIGRGFYLLGVSGPRGNAQRRDSEPAQQLDPRLQAAIADAQKAIDLEPENSSALWLASQCALKAGRLEEARKLGQAAVEIDSADLRLYPTLADVEIAAGDRDKAVQWLRQGRDASPEGRNLQPLLVRLLIELGNVDEAKKEIKTLDEKVHSPAEVYYLRGRLAMLQRDWLAASKQFLEARSRTAGAASSAQARDIEFWLAQAYRQLGNVEQELEAYRRAQRIDRLWQPARSGVANALLRAGRIEEAIEEMRAAEGLAGAASEVYLPLTRLLLLRNMSLPEQQRNWAEVESRLDRLSAEDSASVPVVLLRAELLMAQSRAADAEQLLANAREKNPDDAALWAAQIELAERQQPERAQQLLAEAKERLGDRVSPGVLEARHLVTRIEFDGAASEELACLAADAGQFDEGERVVLYRGLLTATTGLKEPAHAAAVCAAVAEQAPKDLVLWQQLFQVAQRAENTTLMDRAITEIQGIEGDGPTYHYCQAVRLSTAEKPDSADLDQALVHLGKARQLRPQWPAVLLLSAVIHDQQGDAEAAVEEYLSAIDAGVDSPDAIRRTVELLYQREDYRKASELLVRLERQTGPFSTELQRLKSISGRPDRFDDALPLARAVAKESDDYRDHLWLGQVLTIMGQRTRGRTGGSRTRLAEAEQVILRARDMAKDRPARGSPWSIFWSAAADRRRLPLLAEIEASVAAEEVAACPGELLSRPGTARRSRPAVRRGTQETAGQRPDPPGRRFLHPHRPAADGQGGLRRIAEGKLAADAAEQAWRRRALALDAGGRRPAKSRCGGRPDREKPRGRFHSGPRSPHEGDPGRLSGEEEAAGGDRDPRTARDRGAAGGRGDAASARRSLCTSRRPRQAARHWRMLNDRDSLFRYVQYLLSQNELTEAEFGLVRILNENPDDTAALQLRADLLFRSKQYDEALKVLKSPPRPRRRRSLRGRSSDPRRSANGSLRPPAPRLGLRRRGRRFPQACRSVAATARRGRTCPQARPGRLPGPARPMAGRG